MYPSPTVWKLRTEPASLLLVGPERDEKTFLKSVLGSSCLIMECTTRAKAVLTVRVKHVAVVICNRDQARAPWRELLEELKGLPDPPLVIVASRLADERLWAEALNLGAWDVVAKPFDGLEMARVLTSALNNWFDRHRFARQLALRASEARNAGSRATDAEVLPESSSEKEDLYVRYVG